MSEEDGIRELAMPPEYWAIELLDGRIMTVLAHGYSVVDEHVVFTLIFVGKPNPLVETVRIPLDVIQGIVTPAFAHEFQRAKERSDAVLAAAEEYRCAGGSAATGGER